jgi:hypothetical protein
MTEQVDRLPDLTDDDFGVISQPTTGALQRMEAEARSMHTAFQIASSLSKTAMVPEQYQQAQHGETAAYNLCAAIMYGAELGLSAVQSAQNVFIVRGKPAIYSTTMAAVIRRAGFIMEEVEVSDKKVVWKALRDDTWAFSEWTIDRASQAGYTTNKLYQTNPIAMLRAKCIAELARIKFQDCITGLSHSIEELQLESVNVQRVVKRERGAAVLKELAKEKEPEKAPEPELPKVEPPKDEEPEPEKAPSSDQLDTIRRLYKAKGVVGQSVLEETALFLQRSNKLTSLHKLTAEEADEVIASLQEPAEATE